VRYRINDIRAIRVGDEGYLRSFALKGRGHGVL
jgi:hypothetical protein